MKRPRGNRVRLIARLMAAVAFALLICGQALGQDNQPRIYVLPTSGIVDQVMAGYLHEGIARAAREGYSAVVIQLNTPGGALDATQNIVTTLLEAPLPTIVWVAPSGSRAASAGTFITIAAHLAVMAPATRIGAATPIDSNGQDIQGALGEKIMQDTQAMLRSINELRPQRNVEWALTTVVDARSYTGAEALAEGAIDGIAATLPDVIAFADGRTVTVHGQSVTLDLAGAETAELPMNPLQAFLHLLSDPNIAFILFTVGFYGFIFELQNPNFVTGILGAIAIILAFIGFGSLPLNVGGLLLIALAVVLFILEFTITSHGLLTIAGLVCFVLGAAALYTEPGLPSPDISVALPVLLTMTLLTAGFMVFVLIVMMRTRNMTTADGLIGAGLPASTIGQVRRPLKPVGSVYAGGEEWTARSADERAIARGTPVRIIRQEGLTLVVEPTEGPAAEA